MSIYGNGSNKNKIAIYSILMPSLTVDSSNVVQLFSGGPMFVTRRSDNMICQEAQRIFGRDHLAYHGRPHD
eukprot:scaffold12572_cov110-Skeletonema_menzelii.AAC.2